MRFFVADDSVQFRRGIRKLAEVVEDIELVGEAETAAETLAEVERLEPDVLVLALQLGESSGLEVVKALSNRRARPVIILVTDFCNELLESKRGIDYVVDKSLEVERLIEILIGVAFGKAVNVAHERR